MVVSKWVISPTYKWAIPWDYLPWILTIDPNVQRDIQRHQAAWLRAGCAVAVKVSVVFLVDCIPI